MTLTLDGKLYRISPTGLVWAGYTHANASGTLWRRMERGSPHSRRVLVAAGLEAPEPQPAARRRDRHYADRHHIKYRQRG